jgi:hypothetical protein
MAGSMLSHKVGTFRFTKSGHLQEQIGLPIRTAGVCLLSIILAVFTNKWVLRLVYVSL